MTERPPGLPAEAEEVSVGGFNLTVGPLFRLPDAEGGAVTRFAFAVAEKHMNSAGSVHGGMLMSFMDVAMSRTSRAASGAPRCSTVSLTCDFVGPGRLGDLIEARVRVTRLTRTMVFLSGELRVGERVLLVANGLVEDRGRWRQSRHDRAAARLHAKPSSIDPFEIYLGPVFEKQEGGERRFAFAAWTKRHVNMRGVLHGGMLMTFADCTLGQTAWDVTGKAACVTMSMQTQFLKPAKCRRSGRSAARARAPHPRAALHPRRLTRSAAKPSSSPPASGNFWGRIDGPRRGNPKFTRWRTLPC